MNTKPCKEHQWLQNLLGEWEYEVDCSGAPGGAAEKLKGSETVRSLGEFWVVAEGEGEMPGGGVARHLMTLGYDPAKGRYVGTWIGSVMDSLWVYDGGLDPEQKVLTLETEGPVMGEPGKLGKYRDIVEIKGDGRRNLSSFMQGDDGNWIRFMTADYRRRR